MTTRNPITGDEIKSKVNTKEYEDNYDRIFKRKPQSLDAAYERRAMMQGLVVNPLFPENKELVEQSFVGVDLAVGTDTTVIGFWPETEERIDIIAQNGNNGEHYEENKD